MLEGFALEQHRNDNRFLDEEEIKKLLAACPEPTGPKLKKRKMGLFQGAEARHLKDFVVIALNTGMRKGEILSLKWDQIRNGFIYLEKTKTNEARQIPINADLASCFEDIRKRNNMTSGYIFPDDNGGYLGDIKTAFKSALKRAGIIDFRPHDLRHTFASHYIMRGGSLNALKEILGHSDIKMTMRYAHLSKKYVKEEIQIINGLTSGQKERTAEESTALIHSPHCHKSVTFSDSASAPLG